MLAIRRGKGAALTAAAVSILLVAAGCGSSKSNSSSGTSSGGSSSAPPATQSLKSNTEGVTSSTITIGTLADLSGAIPGLFQGAIYGTEAYADYINSQGGVNGRKLVVKTGDTGLSCNLTKNTA